MNTSISKFGPIDPTSTDRFKLWCGPDGIYRVDGRIIPVADNTALCVNDDQSVVPVVNPNHRQEEKMGYAEAILLLIAIAIGVYLIATHRRDGGI